MLKNYFSAFLVVVTLFFRTLLALWIVLVTVFFAHVFVSVNASGQNSAMHDTESRGEV